MLHTLAPTDATGVRTHGNLELCRHQQHGEVPIHSRKPATVDLNHIDELLEHHPVMAVFTGSDPNGGNLPANAGVPKDVVWTRGIFHPPWIYLGEFLGAVDCFHNVPFLIRVHHQLVEGPNFRSHQMGPTKIVGRIAAHLQLEMGPNPGRDLRGILEWDHQGDDTRVYLPSTLPGQYAYVLRRTGPIS